MKRSCSINQRSLPPISALCVSGSTKCLESLGPFGYFLLSTQLRPNNVTVTNILRSPCSSFTSDFYLAFSTSNDQVKNRLCSLIPAIQFQEFLKRILQKDYKAFIQKRYPWCRHGAKKSSKKITYFWPAIPKVDASFGGLLIIRRLLSEWINPSKIDAHHHRHHRLVDWCL
jgi:hypothetical protein